MAAPRDETVGEREQRVGAGAKEFFSEFLVRAALFPFTVAAFSAKVLASIMEALVDLGPAGPVTTLGEFLVRAALFPLTVAAFSAKVLASVVEALANFISGWLRGHSADFKIVVSTVAIVVMWSAVVMFLGRALPEDGAETEGGGAGTTAGAEAPLRSRDRPRVVEPVRSDPRVRAGGNVPRPAQDPEVVEPARSDPSARVVEPMRAGGNVPRSAQDPEVVEPARSDPPARVVEPMRADGNVPRSAQDPEVVEPARSDPPAQVVEPVRAGGNVPRPARDLDNVEPEYPRLARLRRIQGIVILEVTVDRQGDVSNVSVLRSVDGLDGAAVDALRQWRYEPTIVNGRPVSVIFTEAVRFELEN